MKKILGIMIVMLFIFGIGVVSAHGETDSDYDEHHDGMMSGFYGVWGMGLFGWTFMALVIVALVLFIIWLVKQLEGGKKK